MGDENLFTATEVARGIGCSKQNVHKQLDAIPADGEKLVAGNDAKAWQIESLPQSLIEKLENVRARKGYATIADLLQSPFMRFALHVPLAQIKRSVVATAQKRQETVVETIPRRYQDGKRAGPKELRQPRSAFGEIIRHLVAMALRRKFTLLPAVRVIRMTPTVLKNNQARFRGQSCRAGEPNDQLRFGLGRDDRKRDRNRPRNRY